MTTKITRYEDIPQFTRDGSYQVNMDPDDMIEDWLPKMVKEGLNLDPDFQRAHVWTEAQQIAWVEFFLRGGKTGRIIYFNHPGWMRDWQGDFVLVDGKQRLEAMRRFWQNEIPAFGSLRNEFTDRLRMWNTSFLVNVNNLKSRAEVLRWYIDMNAGGTPHTAEEIAKVRALLVRARRDL